jgi:hypothetical protein
MRRLAVLTLAALALGAGATRADAAVAGPLQQRGPQVSLNPQPLPPDPDKSMGINRFQPGQRQMLNPQPLPPRQLQLQQRLR